MPKRPKETSARLRSSRGMTIVELLVVVAIIAVLAGVAVWSMTPNVNRAQMADFAGEIQNTFKEARGRALLTRNRYAVRLTPTTVEWCETDCPPPAGKEKGRVANARGGARAVSFAQVADIGLAAIPPRTELGETKIYFYGDGTVDSDRATAVQEGFTAYLQHSIRTHLQHRVAVLPLSGDIRKYDEW